MNLPTQWEVGAHANRRLLTVKRRLRASVEAGRLVAVAHADACQDRGCDTSCQPTCVLQGASVTGASRGSSLSRAVSSGERTTLSNGLRLLVNDGGSGDGPVSIDYAGESGDLAGIPGGCVAAVSQSDAGTLRMFVASTGGRPPLVPRRSALRLAPAEREEISRGVVAGDSCRMIGQRIRRAASTVSREIAGNGGRHRYRACQAEQAAWRRARRPKAAKLVTCPQLRQVVEAKLASRWSPQQIAGWLTRAYPDDRELEEDVRDLTSGRRSLGRDDL